MHQDGSVRGETFTRYLPYDVKSSWPCKPWARFGPSASVLPHCPSLLETQRAKGTDPSTPSRRSISKHPEGPPAEHGGEAPPAPGVCSDGGVASCHQVRPCDIANRKGGGTEISKPARAMRAMRISTRTHASSRLSPPPRCPDEGESFLLQRESSLLSDFPCGMCQCPSVGHAGIASSHRRGSKAAGKSPNVLTGKKGGRDRTWQISEVTK